MIIYLHGWNSSPLASKAVLLAEYCANNGLSCVVPQLHHRPQQAVAEITALVETSGEHLLVGSSMGGFYANWFCEKHDNVRAVLINPALCLGDKLAEYVGQEQQNEHTKEKYMFSDSHVEEFRRLEVSSVADSQKYLLLTQRGDELLDYREAVEFFAGAQQVVEDGGDHSFVDFARHLPLIAEFAGEAVFTQTK